MIPREQKTMTRNSYLKLEIRTRMERTGESYSAASRAVAKGEELPEKGAEFPQKPFTPPTDRQRRLSVENGLETMTISGRFEKATQLKALIIFSERVYALEQSGMAVSHAIEILAPITEDLRLREALFSIVEEIKPSDGSAFGSRPVELLTALTRRSDVFPGILIPLVRSGASLRPLASVYRTELELL